MEARRHPWSNRVWIAVGCLFLVPVVAGRVAEGFAWKTGDYLIFAVMLAVACGVVEIAGRVRGDRAYLEGAAVAAGAGVGLVFVNMAVGIIGSEGQAENLLFAGVLGVVLVGSAIARLRPAGLARTMVGAAAAQIAVGAYALGSGAGVGANAWPWDVIGATVIFTGLWVLAARRFAASARSA